VDTYTGAIWEIIQGIRHFYCTDFRIQKLRRQFIGARRGSGAVSVQLQRKIAGNWRCIKYAIKNEVPKESFVITNYERMQQKKSNSSDSGGSESDSDSGGTSSTFDEVLDVPIAHLPQLPINYPFDVSLAPVLEREEVSENADAESTAPAQAPNNKKTNKRKKKRRSSGRPVQSKFVRV
jgi:hypothetical protein